MRYTVTPPEYRFTILTAAVHNDPFNRANKVAIDHYKLQSEQSRIVICQPPGTFRLNFAQIVVPLLY
jgi:hypothetical protein